jgi:aspartyl-tRNA(Asn)/glutamyl-tRNA(Gln) amidotransferase subunit C
VVELGFTTIFVIMEINSALVENIAHLSRLYFTDEEKKEIEVDMQRMSSFVEKLSEITTTGIEPLQHMGSSINVLREDEIKGSVSREEALLNAPVTDGTFFKVPKVIKK